MTLKSALEDFRQTTLVAVSGLLGKLTYLASLQRPSGRYEHWGMQSVYGAESAERALRAAHAEVLAGVLQTPVARLMDDLEESRRNSGVAAMAYIDEMRKHFEHLLPGDRQDSPAAAHLSSVLVSLSKLERNRVRATRSTS